MSSFIGSRFRYLIAKNDGSLISMTEEELQNKWGNRIDNYIKKMLADDELKDGDLIYEVRPILKMQSQVVAKRIKTL
jgi:hypothetical protein